MIIAIYYQIKTPIDFWCRVGRDFLCYDPSHQDHKAIKMVLVQRNTKPPK